MPEISLSEEMKSWQRLMTSCKISSLTSKWNIVICKKRFQKMKVRWIQLLQMQGEMTFSGSEMESKTILKRLSSYLVK